MRKPRLITGKLPMGRVHYWLRGEDMKLHSLCGLEAGLRSVLPKGFMWPICLRCAKTENRERDGK